MIGGIAKNATLLGRFVAYGTRGYLLAARNLTMWDVRSHVLLSALRQTSSQNLADKQLYRGGAAILALTDDHSRFSDDAPLTCAPDSHRAADTAPADTAPASAR